MKLCRGECGLTCVFSYIPFYIAIETGPGQGTGTGGVVPEALNMEGICRGVCFLGECVVLRDCLHTSGCSILLVVLVQPLCVSVLLFPGKLRLGRLCIP